MIANDDTEVVIDLAADARDVVRRVHRALGMRCRLRAAEVCVGDAFFLTVDSTEGLEDVGVQGLRERVHARLRAEW